MKQITGKDRDVLDELASAIDKELGYPFAGVDVGGGRHVPPEMSMTLHHADVVYDNVKGEYCYDIDEKVEELAGKSVDVDGKFIVVDLSSAVVKDVDAEVVDP